MISIWIFEYLKLNCILISLIGRMPSTFFFSFFTFLSYHLASLGTDHLKVGRVVTFFYSVDNWIINEYPYTLYGTYELK